MINDFPEEDKYLREAQKPSICKHEWVDMYYGAGFVRGDQTRGIQVFYCKFCLRTRTIEYDQSRFNLHDLEDEATDYRDK